MSELEFISELYSLNGENKIDEALDLIFLWTDDRFKAGEFAVCDSMLAMIDPSYFGEDLIVGLITATFKASDKLQQMEEFISRCHYQLEAVVGPEVASEIYSELSIKLGVSEEYGALPRSG